MPYAIRKVPRVDGYRVVNTETGEAHSCDALPWDVARRQLRALYRAANEKAPRIRRAPPARHARAAAHVEPHVSGAGRHGGADEERAPPPAAPRGRVRAPPPPWISRPPRPPPRRRAVPVPAEVPAPVVAAAAVLEDDDLMNEEGAVPLHDMVFARNPVTGAWGFVQGPPQPRPRSPSPTGVRDLPYEYW